MSQYHTQVCLVSEQAAANLLPLCDDSLKPKQVILIATKQMKKRAEQLASVLKPRSISPQIVDFESSHDYTKMEEQLIALQGRIENNGPFALNVTGGTKWMAIVAQEIFRSAGADVFYMDLASGRVLFVDSEKPARDIDCKISVKDYLAAYGYEADLPNSRGSLPAEQEFNERVLEKIDHWQEALGQLNGMASRAESANSLKACLPDKPDQHLNALLAEAEHGQFCTLQGDKVIFKDREARQFLGGGWLEVYVNKTITSLKTSLKKDGGLITDGPYMNAIIQGEKTKNEMDVVFMARGRLYFIECKTKRMDGERAHADDALYKLDTLRHFGGLGTGAMIVSYRPLRGPDRERAQDMKIKLCEGQDIRRLKEKIRQWIGK